MYVVVSALTQSCGLLNENVTLRGARSPRTAHADDAFVGSVEDIDEILGRDLVPSHLGSSAVVERTGAQDPSSPENANTGHAADVAAPLHVVIGSSDDHNNNDK